MSFFVTLQSNFQHVMLYENPDLQQKARSCIPHQQLSSAAQHKLKEAKEADPGTVYMCIILQVHSNNDSEGLTDSLSCL